MQGRCFGGRGNGMFGFLGLESPILKVWVGYVAGLWDFGCRLREVDINWSGMLSDSAIAFALGLYDVTAWVGSLFDNGAGYVFICYW